jgi:methyl-accepting chemotaxis protein
VKSVARLTLTFAGLLALLSASVALLAASATDAMQIWVALFGSGVLLVAGLASWSALRSVNGRIQQSLLAAKQMAAGDLTGQFQMSNDEFGELLRALAALKERLFAAVTEVRAGTNTMATTAAQIRRDNDTLSNRTTKQTNYLQQTAASMEQLTSTVKHNSENAGQASELVQSASERAFRGGQVVGEAVQTMDRIEKSSRKISDIVGVIDSIAFQTNILALNAAVEAARAGEQGRGFAVVAAEVGTLAKRSAAAAKQIKLLIGDSVEQVAAGGKLVEAAGQAMQEIVASVQNISQIVVGISTASREQSIGIESINQAVTRLDGMTGRHSAMVDGAVQTAAMLSERALALLKAVSIFNLGKREYGNADDAVELVKRGVEFANTHGMDALLQDINKLANGRFLDRDLYLLVLDLDTGAWVAHGTNPRVVGVVGTEIKDLHGRHFVQDLVRVAKSEGQGWVEYRWAHPVTNEEQDKATYIVRVGDYGVGAGIYKSLQ